MSVLSGESSWALTCAISPRTRVRLAASTAAGEVLNSYPRLVPMTGPAPQVPWAVHLADASGAYRLLVFDLDPKGDPLGPARDAEALSARLSAAGIEHVVCVSGPSGGRHVWVGLAEGIDGELVADLAAAAAALYPCLDKAPLLNPVAGCCRPPGAPHRGGSFSRVVAGDVEVLRSPSTTRAQIHDLVAAIAAELPGGATTPPRPLDARVPYDAEGHPYLPGQRRSLPPASAAAAVHHPGADEDASALLWQVLIGAAAARWHYEDVAALVDSPGLEHARTRRVRKDSPARAPRPTGGPASLGRVLTHQWRRAVVHVATTPRLEGTDDTFDERAGELAACVHELQARADASPGRWSRPGGPSDRRVLDALCGFALDGMTAVVEADVRRLAMTAGLGRETARTALLRLAGEGWIAQDRPSAGTRAAYWKINPQSLVHSDITTSRSQAFTRPPGAGTLTRGALQEALSSRLTASRHDVFTGGGLGLGAGTTYARLAHSPTTVAELAVATGQDLAVTRAHVDVLVSWGLARVGGNVAVVTAARVRDVVAKELGVAGVLAAREELYRLERAMWAWWQAEQTWMQARGAGRRGGRAGRGQGALQLGGGLDAFPPYPRRSVGRRRGDHRAAREAATGGQLAHLYAAAA